MRTAAKEIEPHNYGDDHWIQTYTGGKFWPLDPKPEDIHIDDIAHSLSLTCRFGGHAKKFYSVAQHSVLVSELCVGNERWGLLHDAAEAYLADICRPIKSYMQGFDGFEEAILKTVAERFCLVYPIPDSVMAKDLRLLSAEKIHVMGGDLDWPGLEMEGPCRLTITPWTSGCAEVEFLRKYRQWFPAWGF